MIIFNICLFIINYKRLYYGMVILYSNFIQLYSYIIQRDFKDRYRVLLAYDNNKIISYLHEHFKIK